MQGLSSQRLSLIMCLQWFVESNDLLWSLMASFSKLYGYLSSILRLSFDAIEISSMNLSNFFSSMHLNRLNFLLIWLMLLKSPIQLYQLLFPFWLVCLSQVGLPVLHIFRRFFLSSGWSNCRWFENSLLGNSYNV
jgi:hypothetical protein